MQTYQPEIWSVKKDDIYAAIAATESGIEYAQECLATHDQSLGRTTRKNKRIAEQIENDLRQMTATLAALRLLPNGQKLRHSRTAIWRTRNSVVNRWLYRLLPPAMC